MNFRTSSHYLLYWTITPEERRRLAERKKANYAAGRHLRKVKPGDVLWIVNVYLQDLLLIGRILVETVVSDSDVAQELVETEEEWQDADWYAIANKYNIEPMREVNISHFSDQLRFMGKSNRLHRIEGKIDANQLRPLRELTRESVDVLEMAWYSEVFQPETAQDFLEIAEDDRAYAEGQAVVRTRQEHQRSRKLVQDAKERFMVENRGRLYCEVCGFDFEEVYGLAYIEAHHLVPMAAKQEERQSRLDDLTMLCANCHRMIHSQVPPLTIDELKAMMSARVRR